jgi:hypothetical protein
MKALNQFGEIMSERNAANVYASNHVGLAWNGHFIIRSEYPKDIGEVHV